MEQGYQERLSTDSYFDGGLIELLLLRIFGSVVTIFTFGIAYPWVLCLIYGWRINHTVIEGKRLRFTGSAVSLFIQWLKWLALIFITFGIYSFWVSIALEKWRVSNTEFAN